jgi:hypothetical protein
MKSNSVIANWLLGIIGIVLGAGATTISNHFSGIQRGNI